MGLRQSYTSLQPSKYFINVSIGNTVYRLHSVLITERFVRQLGAIFVHCEFATSFIFKKDCSPRQFVIISERLSLKVILVFGKRCCSVMVHPVDRL